MTQRLLSGYRFVEINHGDTLQVIAARELGDAARWSDLVAINRLTHPYITGDPALAGERVKLYGQLLIVPAAKVQVSAAVDPDRVFGVDLDLEDGVLKTDGAGDFKLIAGRANLRQAISHRIMTPLRELVFHLAYGCGVHRLKGAINGPTAGLLGARYVRDAMLEDPRVDAVLSTVADVAGDSITIEGRVQPVAGTAFDLSSSI